MILNLQKSLKNDSQACVLLNIINLRLCAHQLLLLGNSFLPVILSPEKNGWEGLMLDNEINILTFSQSCENLAFLHYP